MRRLAIMLSLALLGMAAMFAPHQAESLTADHTECNFCHNLHGAAGYDSLLVETTAEATCLSCHGPGGSSSLKADVHRDDDLNFRFTCTVCHDSHSYRDNWLGGTNIKLVGRILINAVYYDYAALKTPNNGIQNVVMESRGDNDAGEPTLHSFADGDEDGNGIYDGICEVCHTTTMFHRNNSSGNHSHYVGETCTRCHAHVDWFMPSNSMGG